MPQSLLLGKLDNIICNFDLYMKTGIQISRYQEQTVHDRNRINAFVQDSANILDILYFWSHGAFDRLPIFDRLTILGQLYAEVNSNTYFPFMLQQLFDPANRPAENPKRFVALADLKNHLFDEIGNQKLIVDRGAEGKSEPIFKVAQKVPSYKFFMSYFKELTAKSDEHTAKELNDIHVSLLLSLSDLLRKLCDTVHYAHAGQKSGGRGGPSRLLVSIEEAHDLMAFIDPVWDYLKSNGLHVNHVYNQQSLSAYIILMDKELSLIHSLVRTFGRSPNLSIICREMTHLGFNLLSDGIVQNRAELEDQMALGAYQEISQKSAKTEADDSLFAEELTLFSENINGAHQIMWRNLF